MRTQQNVALADFTSFGTGGPAQTLITIDETSELADVLRDCVRPIWFLGDGANVLVSDDGLPGTTLHLKTSEIKIDDETFVVDAGVEWDTLVQKSIDHNLWGLERTSGIPGSVGAAVVGNIAAYGQAVSETLQWVDVIDTKSDNQQTVRLSSNELGLEYRYSKFQTPEFKTYLITRAAFTLSKESKPLEYASALKVASELSLDANDLNQRREIILEARRRIGSLLEGDNKHVKTAGSFFRNPLVTPEQAEQVMSYEERGINYAQIKKQNAVHGGSAQRVSAAHVLLAAGFTRGQTWNQVRLHPDHILKIENMGTATSRDIHNVAQEIIETVKEKLGINLEPEVRFLGKF